MKQNIILILLFVIATATAQDKNFDEKEFFKKINESYYTLSDTRIKNFTALVTSAKMEAFAEENWENNEVFPLQLIWFNPDKIYLSQQGVPQISEEKYKEYQDVVSGLKMQVKGILLDLQRFYLVGMFRSIGEDYVLKTNEDAVQVTYLSGDKENPTKVKYLLGYNGLCLMIEIFYPAEEKTIVIYPEFKTVKNKWLCKGWKVQTAIKGEIQSGFNLVIKNSVLDNIWVPTEILLEVQKADQKGSSFYDQLKLRNYMFNQSMELMDKAN